MKKQLLRWRWMKRNRIRAVSDPRDQKALGWVRTGRCDAYGSSRGGYGGGARTSPRGSLQKQSSQS